AERPFDLRVGVDRGVATFPYPASAADEAFLADPLKGWGWPPNTQSSPAYVEIAAVPSATVTLRQGEVTLGEVRWGEVETRGRVETPRARVEVVDPGQNWVFTTVVDDETGEPIPCRVHFR